MRKNELIASLSGIDGDPKVFMAVDEEGNDFNEVYEIVVEDEEESDLYYENGGPVIVLWP